MEHWRYAVVKDKKGNFRIAEYFYEHGYTQEPLEMEADSKKDLIWLLETALADAKRYRTIVGKK